MCRQPYGQRNVHVLGPGSGQEDQKDEDHAIHSEHGDQDAYDHDLIEVAVLSSGRGEAIHSAVSCPE